MTTRPDTMKFSDLPTSYEALVQFHPPRPIHDDVALDNVLEIVDLLAGRDDLNPAQEDYLDILSHEVERYEAEHHAFGNSKLTPVQALKALMEANDLTASDLGKLLGERSLGSKILGGHRELSKTHIRILTERFKVSADLFLS